MLNKALLKKDFKLSAMVILVLTMIFVIAYPLRTIMELNQLRVFDDYQTQTHMFEQSYHGFVENIFMNNPLTMFSVIGVVVLGGVLIGLERNTRRHVFNLSLPFARRKLFGTKAIIGLVSITTMMTLSVLAAYSIIWSSEYSELLTEFHLVDMLVIPLLTYLAIFAFTLFTGTVAGEMISQIVLSFIFLIFPYGFLILTSLFLRTHGMVSPPIHTNEWINDMVMSLVLPLQLGESGYIHEYQWLITLIFLVVSLFLGNALYKKGKSERNGEFLLFPSLKPFFMIGIVGCSALLGGMIFSAFGQPAGAAIPFYWLGAIVVGGLAFWITRRLLQMNVTMKNN
ncbi:hypothetical protein [Natribacillus halophilus]|uniref:ABC-2 type transport system permease protein n=1 Tax=Natribacillus halophilus TaxID=549003 RepID=A0A1G8KZM7_9BACI|nr:hypothetical protein [Natribacillus halophilus]SDI48862.1 hypothetical protein SAMN04488123_102401 [Natribacillus halophilus]